MPSLLCLSYSGACDGPGEAFGFEVGSFAVESEDLQLSSPELHAARSGEKIDRASAVELAVDEVKLNERALTARPRCHSWRMTRCAVTTTWSTS